MRFVVLLVACLLAAGCTRAVEGTPAAPSGVLLPPRPREVRLDGVDPCSLLTAEQRAGLGLTSEPRASRPYVELFRGVVPTCTMSGSTTQSIILGIGTVTTVGIERWQQSDIAAEVSPTTVGGFPSLVTEPAASSAYCGVEVDVAVRQVLDVQLLDGGGEPPIARSRLCDHARRAAQELVASLLSR